jgi:hypothetical protein
MDDSRPELVISITGQIEFANSTFFVLYKSGRILSRIGDAELVAPMFFEQRLSQREHEAFLNSLPLEEFRGLDFTYDQGLTDAPDWFIRVWTAGGDGAVHVRETGLECAKSGHNLHDVEGIPRAVTSIFDAACRLAGRGTPWYPESFKAEWSVEDSYGPTNAKGTQPWPAQWSAFAPSVMDRARSFKKEMPGTLLPEVETFLRDCRKRSQLVGVGDRHFWVSVSFSVPGERSWH